MRLDEVAAPACLAERVRAPAESARRSSVDRRLVEPSFRESSSVVAGRATGSVRPGSAARRRPRGRRPAASPTARYGGSIFFSTASASGERSASPLSPLDDHVAVRERRELDLVSREVGRRDRHDGVPIAVARGRRSVGRVSRRSEPQRLDWVERRRGRRRRRIAEHLRRVEPRLAQELLVQRLLPAAEEPH